MNPTEFRVSPNFMLSDFLGNHSVFSRGLPNVPDENDPEWELKLANIRALATHILEPILETFGPLSIGYSLLSPATSRALVKYQDPDKPSHHLWNLGAAADICVHRWVNKEPERDDYDNSPIALAFRLSKEDFQFSRLITYSESPYVCVAASAQELEEGSPRLAFYENRYGGPGTKKPVYIKSPSPIAKASHEAQCVLEHGWRGAGYPTQHSLKIRQLHHRRVSKYTMLTDWLFDLSSITNGARNVPKTAHTDLLYRAGDFYDRLIDGTGYNRFSIVQGFNTSWATKPRFVLAVPGDIWTSEFFTHLQGAIDADGNIKVGIGDTQLHVTL